LAPKGVGFRNRVHAGDPAPMLVEEPYAYFTQLVNVPFPENLGEDG
jgi:hypothetical protein